MCTDFELVAAIVHRFIFGVNPLVYADARIHLLLFSNNDDLIVLPLATDLESIKNVITLN